MVHNIYVKCNTCGTPIRLRIQLDGSIYKYDLPIHICCPNPDCGDEFDCSFNHKQGILPRWYVASEKDMPKQFEAVRDIINLQKEVEALKEHNKWHRIDENPDDLPTKDKEYLVKVIFDVGTGNEHIFLAQWRNENKFWDSLYEKDIVAWKDPE